ncbi:MAG: DoxX family protein [Gemmatimonadota bacterium]|jgi:putative oxidoreductase
MATTGANGVLSGLAKFTPVTHVILRIAAGLLFMQHGAQKLFGWFGGMGGSGATAELFSQMGFAGVLEFFGGLLIVIGLLTRPVALVLVLEMLVAYGMAHMPHALAPIQNGGELALLYAVIFLYFATAGAGRASVDGLIAGRGTRS